MSAHEDHCTCPSCGLAFVDTDSFDAHRVGEHDYLLSPEHPDGRRCLSEQEMCEAGFGRSTAGRWRSRQPLAQA